MIEFALQKKLKSPNGTMLFDMAYTIKQGAFTGISGASGAGKTSLLNMLAGFIKPSQGFIKVNGDYWFNAGKKINLPPQKRKTGFVFQDYALFPNMTVKENLLFALGKGTQKNIVDELLALAELEQLYSSKIQTLSGGQRQRVALARALVRRPQLLLLDEPLSALDAALRQKLQELIYSMHKRFGLTTVLVSHDKTELIRLANEVLFIKDGTIEKSGPVHTVFPVKKIKDAIQLSGTVIAIANENSICISADASLMEFDCSAAPLNLQKGDRVIVSVEAGKTSINKV